MIFHKDAIFEQKYYSIYYSKDPNKIPSSCSGFELEENAGRVYYSIYDSFLVISINKL